MDDELIKREIWSWEFKYGKYVNKIIIRRRKHLDNGRTKSKEA